MALVPMVLENTGRGERVMDLFSKMLENRIVFLNGPVNDDMANMIVAQLLHLEHQNSEADISLYINSPGGSVTAGLAIRDAMDFIKCDVATLCYGQAASMGAVLLGSGAKGKRVILKDARVMVHQVSSGTQGVVMDQRIALEESERLNRRLHEILAQDCGNKFTTDEMIARCSRDYWMSSDQALEFGIVDAVKNKRFEDKL